MYMISEVFYALPYLKNLILGLVCPCSIKNFVDFFNGFFLDKLTSNFISILMSGF